MTRPGIEPRSPGPLANTLTPRPMSGKVHTLGYLFGKSETVVCCPSTDIITFSWNWHTIMWMYLDL